MSFTKENGTGKHFGTRIRYQFTTIIFFDGFADAIIEIVPYYDPFGETEISIEQWNKIEEQIKAKDIKSQEVYYEADQWLRDEVFPKYKCFTILGL